MSDCYCILLRTASRKVTALYDAALAPFGVTLAQFSLMRRIRRGEPVSITDLAQRAELDRSTVGRNLKPLERLGLVQHVTSLDQREASVALTEAGHALLKQADPVWHQVQVDLETRLGAADAGQLTRLLHAL